MCSDPNRYALHPPQPLDNTPVVIGDGDRSRSARPQFEQYVAVTRGKAPHPDPTVLHPPGVCEACDHRAEWQTLREIWGLPFTGQLTPATPEVATRFNRDVGV